MGLRVPAGSQPSVRRTITEATSIVTSYACPASKTRSQQAAVSSSGVESTNTHRGHSSRVAMNTRIGGSLVHVIGLPLVITRRASSVAPKLCWRMCEGLRANASGRQSCVSYESAASLVVSLVLGPPRVRGRCHESHVAEWASRYVPLTIVDQRGTNQRLVSRASRSAATHLTRHYAKVTLFAMPRFQEAFL